MQCFGSEKVSYFLEIQRELCNPARIAHCSPRTSAMRIATSLINIQFADHLLLNEFNFRVNVLNLDQFMFSSVALCLLEFLLQICLKAVSNYWNPAGRFLVFSFQELSVLKKSGPSNEKSSCQRVILRLIAKAERWPYLVVPFARANQESFNLICAFYSRWDSDVTGNPN